MNEEPFFPSLDQSTDGDSALDLSRPELVIAFVAAVGVNLKIAEDATAEKLERIGYNIVRIRVTEDVLPFLDPAANLNFANDYDRIWKMMDIGTTARRNYGESIIALGIAAAINRKRRILGRAQTKTAYLIHSLKHPKEVHTLRELYTMGFYLIGVHSPPESRIKHLMSRRGIDEILAKKLMHRDRKEDRDFGQQLVDTFHLSDFFAGWCEEDDPDKAPIYLKLIRNSIDRFIEIVFGHPNRTPSFGEHAMYLAFASSFRSADLSRQVGAVVARSGEILGMGANDCPRPGGGLYWPELSSETFSFEDAAHGRDWTRKVDSNRKAQLELITSILGEARTEMRDELERYQLAHSISSEQITKLDGALFIRLREVLKRSRIREITEYGRVVHAEMEALLSCARKGISTLDATLYSTTFPCHNCAKHIIASGIRRVVFIEPYLKSRARDFHDDAMQIVYPFFEPKNTDGSLPKVRLEPFWGVGPRRFLDLFAMDLGVGRELIRKEKLSGGAKRWIEKQASPRVAMRSTSYLERESDARSQFERAT